MMWLILLIALALTADNCSSNSTIRDLDDAILFIYKDLQEQIASSGQGYSTIECKRGCCTRSVAVDFEKYGFDWIIAPNKIEMKFCDGECVGTGSNETFSNVSKVQDRQGNHYYFALLERS